MLKRLLLPALFPWLFLLSCNFDNCSSSPASLTPAEAKKCLADMDAEVSEHAFSDAAAQDSLKLVRLYIAAGLSTQDPLSDAAREGSAESMRILLEYGGTPNGEMLRDAVSEGHLEVTQVLLEEGIDPNEASREGPGDVFVSALKHDSPEIGNMLLDYGMKLRSARGIVFDPAAKAACYGHFDLLSRILNETEAEATLLRRARSRLEQGHGRSRMNRILHEDCAENILSDEVAKITGV